MAKREIDDGSRTGKFTYRHKGWKVSVLNREVTQILKEGTSKFFNSPTSEQDALDYIDKNHAD